MAVKKIIDDLQNALSIAQAGIRGTLKSLMKAQSKAKKLTSGKRTNKPKEKPKKRLSAKHPTNPTHLARSVVKAAIREPLTPKKLRKKKPASKTSKKST
ncbi:MAG: hypothetical protein ABIR36_15850 [Nitrospiraceae bacterium]